MLRGNQVRLLGLDACERLLFGSLRGMELAEGGRVDDRHRHLRRASFRAAGVKIGFRVFQLGGVISRIKFQQQGSRLDEAGCFRLAD